MSIQINNNGNWSSILKSAFLAGAAAASAYVLANITCRDNYGDLDWRDLAFLTSIGTVLGVRYAESSNRYSQ